MADKIKAYGVCVYQILPHSTKILLCKSVNSKEKWGFLKGVQDSCETNKETAVREFFEESSIEMDEGLLETYFEQINRSKDIGIYLVNYNKVKDIDKYFVNDHLIEHYISWENSEVRFFNIDNLPSIKKKQYKMVNNIIRYLKKEK